MSNREPDPRADRPMMGRPPFADDEPGAVAGKAPTRRGNAWKWLALAIAVVVVFFVAFYAITRGLIGSDPAPTNNSPVSVQAPGGSPSPMVSQPNAPATGGTDINQLQVGQCLQLFEMPGATPNADSIDVEHEVVDCNLAGQFKLEVGSIHEQTAECPTDYVRYYQENTFGDGDRVTVCLAPVFDPGVCYSYDPIKEWVPVECADAGAEFVVEKELPDTTDPAACAAVDGAFVLPEPAPGRVYCIAPPT